jgi:uncharacterized repeat protein (TIGR03803 family)
MMKEWCLSCLPAGVERGRKPFCGASATEATANFPSQASSWTPPETSMARLSKAALTAPVAIVYELSPSEVGNWTETVLHNFNGDDGSEPWDSPILDTAGNLYGTTSGGGTYSEGTVFELSPSEGGGWTETVLHSFQFDGHDGHSPVVAPLTLDTTGNLFGTTMSGGTNREGIVFELSPRQGGWSETVLYNFGNGNDGGVLFGGLVMDRARDLYGITGAGGLYGYGTAYELTPPAIRPGPSAVN